MPSKAKQPVDQYAEAIERIIALRGERLGLPTIAKKLNEEGIKTKTGKEWRPQTVRQILLRNNAMGEPIVNTRAKAVEEESRGDSPAVTPNATVVKRGRRSSARSAPTATHEAA